MVISPREAIDRKVKIYEKDLEQMEKTIDDKLLSTNGNKVVISMSRGYRGPYDDFRHDVPYDLIERLLDKYRSTINAKNRKNSDSQLGN